MEICGILIAKSPPRIAPKWPFALLKIGHLSSDFYVSLVSGKIILYLGPQSSIN